MKTIAELLGKPLKSIDYDFAKNKYHFKNKKKELKIRYDNLKDIISIFNKYKILHWLQGKTMLGIYGYHKLLENDSDEDIGTDYKNIEIVCEKIIPELEKIGFIVIRATKNNSMVSLLRNNRYLDICFFRHKNNNYYYEQKSFPKEFYEKFIQISVNDFLYTVPLKSKEICKYSYNIEI